MTDQNWYTTTFKAWQTKLLGPKPTNEMLAVAHNLGNKPGKQSLALAMAMRDGGVTGPQIIIACGAPQNNKRRDMIEAAYVRRVPVPNNPEGHTVYKVELTGKGKQRVERTLANAAKRELEGKAKVEAKADKPAKTSGKAKGKLKVKKATKAPVVPAPTSEAADVPTVQVEQPQADETKTA